MAARVLKWIVWLQLLVVVVVTVLSWGPMFEGAVGQEYVTGLQKELEAIQQEADYREPPELRGHTYREVLDRLESVGWDKVRLAGYGFIGGLAVIGITFVELWLLCRLNLVPLKEQSESKEG